MTKNEPFDLRAHVERLCGEFDKAGQVEASQRLRRVLDTAYTTSSEWLGELGLAAREIQRKHKPDGALNSGLDEVMRHVHKVWRRL